MSWFLCIDSSTSMKGGSPYDRRQRLATATCVACGPTFAVQSFINRRSVVPFFRDPVTNADQFVKAYGSPQSTTLFRRSWVRRKSLQIFRRFSGENGNCPRGTHYWIWVQASCRLPSRYEFTATLRSPPHQGNATGETITPIQRTNLGHLPIRPAHIDPQNQRVSCMYSHGFCRSTLTRHPSQPPRTDVRCESSARTPRPLGSGRPGETWWAVSNASDIALPSSLIVGPRWADQIKNVILQNNKVRFVNEVVSALRISRTSWLEVSQLRY